MTSATKPEPVTHYGTDGQPLICDECDATLTTRNATSKSIYSSLCRDCNDATCPHDDTDHGECFTCDRDDLGQVEADRLVDAKKYGGD